MTEAVHTLRYAIRPRVVAKYLGQIALMLAILTSVTMMVSIGYAEYFLTQRYLVVIGILTLFGLSTMKIEHAGDLQANEALTITALAFFITPAFMSYPFMASGLSFVDAWFEAVSAITTTGLSTVDYLEDKPRTFLFARAWMQWYGGLGIVVLSVALLMGYHIAIKRLVGPGSAIMMTTTRIYARRMLVIYATITVIGFAILWWMLGDLFLAITHTLAAISTGGFSPLHNSLGDIAGWLERYTIIILSLLGALPLAFYYRLTKGNWREVVRDPEPKVLLFMICVISVLLGIALQHDLAMGWRDSMAHGILLGISAQTTTGFTSLNLNGLSPLSMLLLIIAMVTGGCVGSTAGGIKILRLIIFARLIQLMIQRSAMPDHAVAEPRVADKILQGDEINRVLILIVLYVIVIIISWLVFLAFDYPPMKSLFEVASAVGTVGLSSGITSTGLHPVLKATLCIDMLLGRLEIIALLIILYPPTWLGKHKE